MFRLNLHAKILFFVLGSLVVSLGALSYVIVQRESRLLAEKADEKQHLLALTIYADLKSNMMKGTPRSTLELIGSIGRIHDVERLTVLRRDGTPAFGPPKAPPVSIPRLRDAFSGGGEISFQEQGPVPLHTILFPLKNEKDCSACHRSDRPVLGVLAVSLSRLGALREIRSSVGNLALSLASLIVLIGLILYVVTNNVVLTPLATLREGAERIGRGDLTYRIVMSTKDELQELAEAFNAMAVRLGDSYEEMEQNIRERTAQLRGAMEEIREKARRLLDNERFAAMGRVVAGAAHEIRNPLFGISSIGQIFEKELRDPAHQGLARALLKETTRMNRLVEELLLYGKPAELHREYCDPADLWREVIDECRDDLDRREIRLQNALYPGQIAAFLDAVQIRHVFASLLRNAIDATKAGGVISLKVMVEGTFLLVKVIDTGIGIPGADVDKAFDLFFTTKPKGTGLGLSICRKIVQDHGGEIAVESKEGSGTTVTVRLPCGEQAGQAQV